MRVLLAHGSPDATHASMVARLADRVSKLLGDEVAVSFLSDKRLPEGAKVLPLFLGAGLHVTRDAPQLAAAANCTLLPALGSRADAIATLAVSAQPDSTIFILYQPEGFGTLKKALQPHGHVAYLHGEPSLASLLQRQHMAGETGISIQPVLLFPGHSLARIHRMITDFAIADAKLAPVLCELDGFADLVAGCFREAS